MIIGTVRPEEAKVRDSMDGYHSFHTEDDQEEYGSFEVFWHDGGYIQIVEDPGVDIETRQGWYWWACFPGCLPDGDATGPFASSSLAHEDANEWSPEYDADFSTTQD